MVIIHNTGGGPTPEQAAEAAIQKCLESVEATLSELGRAFGRMTLEEPLSAAAAQLEGLRKDVVVFNLFEGFPDDPPSEVQVGLLLRKLGLRATGCPPIAMHLGLHKDLCKEILAGMGLPVAKGFVIRDLRDLALPLPFPFPAFLKPVSNDASHGIAKDNLVRDRASYMERGSDLLGRFGAGVLAEPFLPGREFICGVVETPSGPEALPPSLVDYSALPDTHPPVLTFAAKWAEDDPVFRLTPTLCPAPVEIDTLVRVRSLALEAYAALRCRGYARVDLREDSSGDLLILEVNPNPDISPSAGLAKQAFARGWNYTDLVANFIASTERGPQWTS